MLVTNQIPQNQLVVVWIGISVGVKLDFEVGEQPDSQLREREVVVLEEVCQADYVLEGPRHRFDADQASNVALLAHVGHFLENQLQEVVPEGFFGLRIWVTGAHWCF